LPLVLYAFGGGGAGCDELFVSVGFALSDDFLRLGGDLTPKTVADLAKG
jgi:hypothetical protein